jgi:hypothetical protein
MDKKEQPLQLIMWLHVIELVKMAIATGQLPYKELSSRYSITKKEK